MSAGVLQATFADAPVAAKQLFLSRFFEFGGRATEEGRASDA